MARGALQVRVLGSISVSRNGTEVELGGRRQRTLLAALAVENGRTVSAGRLTERLWGDDAQPADPRASLYTYLSRLRQALEVDDAIETVGSGWRLNDVIVEVDAARFTCGGEFDNSIRRYDQNIVVFAVPTTKAPDAVPSA